MNDWLNSNDNQPTDQTPSQPAASGWQAAENYQPVPEPEKSGLSDDPQPASSQFQTASSENPTAAADRAFSAGPANPAGSAEPVAPVESMGAVPTDPISGWRSAGYAFPQPQPLTPPSPFSGQQLPLQPPAPMQPTPMSSTSVQHSPYGWNYGSGQTQVPVGKPPRKRSGTAVLIAVLAVICVAALAFAVVMAEQGGRTTVSDSSVSNSSTTPSSNSAVKITTVDPVESGLTTQQIVADNLDSTVVLSMYETGSNFYGQTSEQEVAEASGIVWTADGYIITNAHCVFDEDNNVKFSRIQVTLHNGTNYDATIIGYDTSTDLAVIKVDATDLKPATFGDSGAAVLGDRVVVLGNNSGFGWSATQGIISGLARNVSDLTQNKYSIKCFQIDATINPGNSGGPLFNSSGQVIGINSSKIVETGYESLGFSIPIDDAKPILESLQQNGRVTGRVKLGISGTSVTLSGFEGFQVQSVDPASSLYGKVQMGDIIQYVNDVRVKSYEDMLTELMKYKPGDTVKLTLIHGNSDSTTTTKYDVTATLLEDTGS